MAKVDASAVVASRQFPNFVILACSGEIFLVKQVANATGNDSHHFLLYTGKLAVIEYRYHGAEVADNRIVRGLEFGAITVSIAVPCIWGHVWHRASCPQGSHWGRHPCHLTVARGWSGRVGSERPGHQPTHWSWHPLLCRPRRCAWTPGRYHMSWPSNGVEGGWGKATASWQGVTLQQATIVKK